MPNPFVYGQVLLPGRPFCARPDLEAIVLAAAENQSRIVLVGARRMGKSSLVEHTLADGKHVFVSVDLRGLVSVEDFIDRLALKLSHTLKEHRTRMLPAALKGAFDAIEEVRIHLGPLEVAAKGKSKASTVIRALDAIEQMSRWKPITVFFDEFQDIVENLEERDSKHLLGVLRSEIQRHTRVTYVFAGSSREAMNEIFTGEQSHFYQSATMQTVGPIPQADMQEFLIEQFVRGGRKLSTSAVQAVFRFAGDSPSDQQQFAYHLWTQSTPGEVDRPALDRALVSIMGEVGRRGEMILEEATPAQRRVLFAIALREGQEVSTDSFVRFAGFKGNGSVFAAMRPFLKGMNALIEKRGSRVSYRDRFMRIWMRVQLNRHPGMFPPSKALPGSNEDRELLSHFGDNDAE